MPLHIPFWALPFDEIRELTLGPLQPNHEATLRELVLERKLAACKHLSVAPPPEFVTADTPVPFNLRRLWYELDRFERMTFSGTTQNDTTMKTPEVVGDAEKLIPDRFPAASPYNQEPYKNQKKRNIDRQLEFMAGRLRDSRYSFLFTPGSNYTPDGDGRTKKDLDHLVSSWIGHEKPITVLDVSGAPSEILPTVVGTLTRIVYDVLFWAGNLPVSGRNQPLLLVVDEAHRFVPEGAETSAHRTLSMIAKEGRKYGVGLVVVTQRPSEIDSTILSQCGSMIALRLTNAADRAKVASGMPDDLGALAGLLPALRTGEALCVGEVMPIPSRIRVFKAIKKAVGDDPDIANRWSEPRPSNTSLYGEALQQWRRQGIVGEIAQVGSAASDGGSEK